VYDWRPPPSCPRFTLDRSVVPREEDPRVREPGDPSLRDLIHVITVRSHAIVAPVGSGIAQTRPRPCRTSEAPQWTRRCENKSPGYVVWWSWRGANSAYASSNTIVDAACFPLLDVKLRVKAGPKAHAASRRCVSILIPVRAQNSSLVVFALRHQSFSW